VIITLDERRALLRRGVSAETLELLAATLQERVDQGVARLLVGEAVSEWERGRLAVLAELVRDLREFARDVRRGTARDEGEDERVEEVGLVAGDRWREVMNY
jgi:hypothetical protein